jgi:hypothetical protein
VESERLPPLVFFTADSFFGGAVFFFVAVAMSYELFLNRSGVE